MSGLLDSIVRRRRASASSRLGPPPGTRASYSNGTAPAENGTPHVNGTSAPVVIYHALQLAHPPAEPAPAVAEDPAAPAQASVIEVDQDVTQEFDVASAEVAEAQAATAAPEPAGAAEPPEAAGPADADEADEPAFRQRGRIRRRAKYLRALREIHLRDIGGFMVELHRFGRERPDLVQAKIEGAARIDAELRALEHALATQRTIRELREAGVGGACENCGAVHGSSDRFCATCGRPLDAPAAESADHKK